MNKSKVLKQFLPSKKYLLHFIGISLIALIVSLFLEHYGGKEINSCIPAYLFICTISTITIYTILYFVIDMLIVFVKYMKQKYKFYNAFYSIKINSSFESSINEFIKFYEEYNLSYFWEDLLNNEDYKEMIEEIKSLAKKEFKRSFNEIRFDRLIYSYNKLKEFELFTIYESVNSEYLIVAIK